MSRIFISTDKAALVVAERNAVGPTGAYIAHMSEPTVYSILAIKDASRHDLQIDPAFLQLDRR